MPYAIGVAVFLLAAMFMAWRDQYMHNIVLQAKVESAQATPVIETRIDKAKVMTITNYGPPIKDLKLFLTEYTLDIDFGPGGAHVHYDRFTQANKPTGAMWQHSTLLHDESISVDLKQLPFVIFADFHDVQGNIDKVKDGMRRCYAIRITFRHAVTNKKQVSYDITSGVRNGVSLFSDPEEAGFGGS